LRGGARALLLCDRAHDNWDRLGATNPLRLGQPRKLGNGSGKRTLVLGVRLHDRTGGDRFHLCLETVRYFAAGLGELYHDLLVQPDVHFRRAIERASVAEFLGQLFAGRKAAVQFQQFHQVND
jgi:hypothetical protein